LISRFVRVAEQRLAEDFEDAGVRAVDLPATFEGSRRTSTAPVLPAAPAEISTARTIFLHTSPIALRDVASN
jgi:hypothetical protein